MRAYPPFCTCTRPPNTDEVRVVAALTICPTPENPPEADSSPVNVGEVLGAKRVVISVLLIRSEGEFRATGDQSSPLKAY